jgi:NAD(P)H-flavin reductase/hemoglobin-like flavoprotein
MAIALGGFGGEPGDRPPCEGEAGGPVPLRSAGTEDVAADHRRLLPAAGAVCSGNCPPAGDDASRGTAETAAQINSRLLRKSISQLEPESEHVMAYFFATLFLRNPELRPMFPLAMDTPRRRLFGALTRYVWSCDHPESLAHWLSELARDHRKYGVTQAHYRPFCDALLVTIEAFSGRGWTPEMKTAWEGALSYITAIMTDAAHGAREEPAWLLAEVTSHDPRRPDLAVLRIRPDSASPLPYRAGQHISVQVPRWPRLWREYSIANAPRPDGLLRLHVRAIPGGRVSTALVQQTRIGDTVLIGRARGDMTSDAVASPVVVCVAGGTGLAPIKAIVEALASADRPPPPPSIRLLVGARREEDLYDLSDLQRLTQVWPFLEVIPVVSDDPRYPGSRGTLAEVTPRHLPPGTGDVIISGPPAMVTATAEVVAARAPGTRIHFDPPGPVPADQARGPCQPPT